MAVGLVAVLAVLATPAGATSYLPGTPASFCSSQGTGADQCAAFVPTLGGLKGVAVDDQTGDVYVVDSVNARIMQFSSSGTFIRAFGSGVADGVTPGAAVCTATCFKGLTTGTGAIGTGARGLAVDSSTHTVYVVAAATRVAYFDGTTGAHLGEFTAATASPAAPASFAQSAGIAVDTSSPQHYLYLATGNSTETMVVNKLTVPVGSATPAGYVCQITGKTLPSATECYAPGGTPASSRGLKTDDGIDITGQKGSNLAVDSSGKVWIAETTTRSTVSAFGADGNFHSQHTVPGPEALAFGPTGNLFVTVNGELGGGGLWVQEYNPSDMSTPLSETGIGTVVKTLGIAVDRGTLGSRGHLYISDVEASKVWNYAPAYDLTVTKTGTGAGSVTSVPSGIACGATCTATFLSGTAVELTAAPTAGSTFTGWSGACTGSATTCNVTVDAAKTATAGFTQDPPVVTTTDGASSITQTSATVAGTVNPRGSAVTNCHVEYGTTVAYGSQVPCSPANPGSGTSPVNVTGALTGLTASTAYHYRVVATTAGGTANGSDRTFTTADVPQTCATNPALCPPAPTCATDPSLCPPTPTCATDPSLCPRPVAGSASLAGKAAVKSGKATFTVSCKGASGATCKSSFKLTAKVKAKKRGKTTTKTITVGKGSYDLAAGASEKVTVKLSSAAKSALKKGALTATAKEAKGRVKLPKTPAKKKKR